MGNFTSCVASRKSDDLTMINDEFTHHSIWRSPVMRYERILIVLPLPYFKQSTLSPVFRFKAADVDDTLQAMHQVLMEELNCA